MCSVVRKSGKKKNRSVRGSIYVGVTYYARSSKDSEFLSEHLSHKAIHKLDYVCCWTVRGDGLVPLEEWDAIKYTSFQ